MRAEGWENFPLIRMTNINLLPGAGSLDDLLSDVAEQVKEVHYGAAVVSGIYDLLIDIGSTRHSKTIKLVNEEVRTIPGIDRTVTSFAHLPGNARRRDL